MKTDVCERCGERKTYSMGLLRTVCQNQRCPDPAAPPRVGEGVTHLGYTDRYAYTIIKVTPKTITAQRDKAILLNGVNSGEPDALTFSPGGFFGHTEGTQRYRYERDPMGEVVKFSLRNDGIWRKSGSGKYDRMVFGRSEYRDFNF